MSNEPECSQCKAKDPQTVYGTSALSECCGVKLCDACLIKHHQECHADTPIQSNPDLNKRISDWLS